MSHDPNEQTRNNSTNRYYDVPEQSRNNYSNYSHGNQHCPGNRNNIGYQISPYQTSSPGYDYRQHTSPNYPSYFQSNNEYSVLTNSGNTCFLNSIIYCLINIPELVKHYQVCQFQFTSFDNCTVSKAFADLVDRMQKNSTVRPNELKSALCKYSPVFGDYGQQDAHECLTVLLDALHQESPKKMNDDEERSIITDLFQGQMKYIIKCAQASVCRNITDNEDSFLDLPLFVENTSVSSLPIFNARFFSINGHEHTYTVSLTPNATIQSIIDRLRRLAMPQSTANIVAMRISSDNTFSGQYRSTVLLSQIDDQSTVFYEIDTNERNRVTICYFSDKNRNSRSQLYSRAPLLLKLPELEYANKLHVCLSNHFDTNNAFYDIEEDSLIYAIPTFLPSHPKTIVVKFDEKALLSPKLNQTTQSIKLTAHSRENTRVTLEQCLEKNILSVERMSSNSNTWFCSKCDQYRQATKENRIVSLPRVLVIHLKRFDIASKQSRSKIETFVKYPFELNMNKFLSTESDEDFMYDLVSVSLHTGSFESGHYIAYAKKSSGWFRFGDYSATPISEDEVVSKNAYILFYVRRMK